MPVTGTRTGLSASPDLDAQRARVVRTVRFVTAETLRYQGCAGEVVHLECKKIIPACCVELQVHTDLPNPLRELGSWHDRPSARPRRSPCDHGLPSR